MKPVPTNEEPLFTAKIWGCRGSFPNEPEKFLKRVTNLLDALTTEQITQIKEARLSGMPESETNEMIASFVHADGSSNHHLYLDRGSHTTCIEVRCGRKTYVIDMGSGCIALGKKMVGEQIKKGGLGSTLEFTVLGTHVHLDHLAHGAPFFAPLFVPNEVLKGNIQMFGGVDWWDGMGGALAKAIEPPYFPLSIDEVMKLKKIKTETIHDGFEIKEMADEDANEVKITAIKQNHPQETYGWRIEYLGKVFVFGGDNEPFPGFETACDPKLVKLCKDADVVVNDCQYSFGQYLGREREKMSRRAWGHSFPEANAALIKQAGVKGMFVTTHHDPSAETDWIEALAREVAVYAEQQVSVVAAFEGLEINMLDLESAKYYAVYN